MQARESMDARSRRSVEAIDDEDEVSAATLVKVDSRFTRGNNDGEESSELDDDVSTHEDDIESLGDARSDAPPQPTSTHTPDAMQIVIEFVRPRLAALSGTKVTSTVLFSDLLAEAGHIRACPGLAKFVSLVRNMFMVEVRDRTEQRRAKPGA